MDILELGTGQANKDRKICTISTNQRIPYYTSSLRGKKLSFQCCFAKGCSGLSLSLWVQTNSDAQTAREKHGCFYLGIHASEQSACPRSQTHGLIQKYTLNEVTELGLKWLKYIVWAQKNCQQSLKIALLRSVKFGEIVQENDTTARTEAAAHRSTRRPGEPGLG